jgi:hypothetical protein
MATWSILQHTYLFHNIMNIPDWIPGKPKKFPSPFPVPWRAPKGMAILVPKAHCMLKKKKEKNCYIHIIKYTTFMYEIMHNNKMMCDVRHIRKKFNFHNGKKNFTITNSCGNSQYSINTFRLKKKLKSLLYQE